MDFVIRQNFYVEKTILFVIEHVEKTILFAIEHIEKTIINKMFEYMRRKMFKRKVYDELLEWKKEWDGKYACLLE